MYPVPGTGVHMYGLVMLGRNIDGGDLLRYGIMAWLRDSLLSPF